MGFMKNYLKLNVEAWWDLSHGNWRDIIGSLKMAGLWNNMLVSLIAYNVPCGPWADDQRYHQCKEALAHLFDHHSPQGCPLYLNMLDTLREPAESI